VRKEEAEIVGRARGRLDIYTDSAQRWQASCVSGVCQVRGCVAEAPICGHGFNVINCRVRVGAKNRSYRLRGACGAAGRDGTRPGQHRQQGGHTRGHAGRTKQ
jgi:hypothetical protein